MPKQIKTAKEFIGLYTDISKKKAKDTKAKENKPATKATKKTVFIKKNPKGVTKFKIRRGRYIYTFKATSPDMIKTIESSLSKNVQKVEIKKRIVAKKAKK